MNNCSPTTLKGNFVTTHTAKDNPETRMDRVEEQMRALQRESSTLAGDLGRHSERLTTLEWDREHREQTLANGHRPPRMEPKPGKRPTEAS